MQAVMETLFDTVYLISVITIGIVMIRRCKGERQFRLFGCMAVVLGAGGRLPSGSAYAGALHDRAGPLYGGPGNRES